MRILNWVLFLEKLVGELPISNIDTYIQGMSMGIQDKLFFTDIVNFDVIVDFGCADGTFLEKISNINPNIKIIGYDLDSTMLEKAKNKLKKDAILTDDWNVVINSIIGYKTPLLNLSSVIHEVYSYSNSNTIKKFWDIQVFGGDFKYICIRDMIPSVEIERNEISHFKDDARMVRLKSDKKILDSFESKWGSINTNYRTLIHYLLKYKYTENWEREVNENYLPVSLETIKSKIPSNYKLVFEEDFILPHLKDQIKKDFGIKLTHSTHTKMIIKNLKFK